MIPHGRPALDIHGVAERAGVSPTTWRRRHHAAFAAAVQPLPGSLRPTLYDAAQVDAFLSGKPLPALPAKPHPDDLLTDTEASAVAGVGASTVRADAVNGLMPRGEERHGRRWWTRAAAEARAARPKQYKGRTPGARDKAPRSRPDHRVAEVVAELERAAAGRREPVTADEIAEFYEVSTRTAERIMAKARAERGKAAG
ncbi:DNA-binding protein [Streptomyces sp. PKU-EA00015]|uniref:DNA-binding protein n=1 Tax=Streptomyces sp. PKU-EA00015 TaxID=2748326 RepID=UPI0015A31A36|nr:DNA-binding protein [Streptomyces sp. PKU-EA00015]NWF30854.1 DNA-binding protein [Streptomyces sp. PKU-EA00015]